ncbi:hypothetical protein ACFLYO_05410 [Chloroflexota bacterium]
MNKYMLLYLAPVDAWQQMANTAPEEAQKQMALWEAWFKKQGSAVVEMGSPLGNGQNFTANGSGTTTQAKVAGYSVMEAAAMDNIQAMLGDHPHLALPGSSIEVLEMASM